MEDEESVLAFLVGLAELVFLVDLEHNLAVFNWVVLELGERLLVDKETTFITASRYCK